MITFHKASSQSDLNGIMQLQRENLPSALTPEEISSQGFVTVVHTFEDLKKLNEIERHIIAKDEEEVMAYLLAMTAHSKFDIPVLQPMFELFSQVAFAGGTISDFNYIVVGQVCVSKNYRSIGVLDHCYDFYRETYKGKYDLAITEIAFDNKRSLNAHKRIGFKEVHHYKAPDKNKWVIVSWDWNEIDKTGGMDNLVTV